MRRLHIPLFIFLLVSLLPGKVSAQETAFWELTHSNPPNIVGDTANRSRHIQFYKSKRERADLLDGAGGGHYAVWGDIFVSEGQSHALWTSSDNGLTWHEALRSPLSSGAGWHFSDLSCPEPNYLYVLALQGSTSRSGKIWRSTDGGGTWGETTFPGMDEYTEQGQIAMSDGLNGFVVLAASEGFFRTTDGWKTWEWVATPTPAGGDIFCPEPNVYFATDGTSAHRSTDNGATWTTSEAGPFSDYVVRKYSFVDRDYGWAVTAEPTGVGHRERSRIARTTDGGGTWTELYNGEEITNGGGLLTVEFADRMNGLIGGRGGIYRTTDGGVNWTPEELPNDVVGPNPFIFYIANPAPGSAVAILTGNYIITTANRTTLPAPVITDPDTSLFDSEDTVTLVWSSVPNATSYQIQMARKDINDLWLDFNASILVDETDLSGTSRFFQLDYGDWHYIFRVRGMNDKDTSQWSALRHIATRNDPTALTTPMFIYPAFETKDAPTTFPLIWHSSPGATRYHLQVSTRPLNLPEAPTLIDSSSITDTMFVLSGLEPHTRYYCGVKAFDDLRESNWSWQITPHPFETGQTSGIDSRQNKETSITILPNPAHGHVTISLPGNAEVMGIFDLRGRLVLTPSEKPTIESDGVRILHLDLENISPGMYILRVRAGDLIRTEPLFVLP